MTDLLSLFAIPVLLGECCVGGKGRERPHPSLAFLNTRGFQSSCDLPGKGNSGTQFTKKLTSTILPLSYFFLLLISQSRCIVPCIIPPKLGLLLGYVLGILCLLANMEIMESLVLISTAVYQQIVYLCYTAIRYLVRMPCGLFRWPELWKRTITLAQVCNFCSVLPNWSNKGILHTCCFSKFHR